MCGIAGWFTPQPNNEHSRVELARMVARLKHRGPDGTGNAIEAHAAFGHARLAIIDLEQGRQPMWSSDHRAMISFNGEIYNYLELRTRLLKQNYRLHTQSDTEVILGLYQTLGVVGFNYLRGMFAFALWDTEKQLGVLVRDTLGIKPLFYRIQGTQVEFASEAKAILARQEEKPRLDENHLHLVLNFRYLPGTRTLFRGIQQLVPGQVLEWRPDTAPVYRTLDPVKRKTYPSTLDALEDSVHLHCTSDVEVGCYLSGGIDSALVAALCKSHTNKSLRSFTLNAGDDPHEAENAQRSAELLGISNLQGTFEPDLSAILPAMVWHLEVPKVNSLQLYLLARFTARHVKVALSGLGGDELFFGYRIHNYLYRAERLKRHLPSFLHRGLGHIATGLARALQRPVFTEWERAGRALAALGNWPRVYGLLRNLWDRPDLRRKIYGPRLLDQNLESAYTVLEQEWPSQGSLLERVAHFEFKNKMVNDLLWQEDRMSMAHGLEVRVPLVDTSLAHHVSHFSPEHLMPNGDLKHYFKLVSSQIVPAEILQRPKSGFQVDAPTFFKQYLESMADRYLTPEIVRAHGLFNPHFVQALRRCTPRKRLRWHFFMLYLMLLSHLWLEIFENQVPHEQL